MPGRPPPARQARAGPGVLAAGARRGAMHTGHFCRTQAVGACGRAGFGWKEWQRALHAGGIRMRGGGSQFAGRGPCMLPVFGTQMDGVAVHTFGQCTAAGCPPPAVL